MVPLHREKTIMPKLNDTQAILLSSASQRNDGSLYPLPDILADAGTRATKAVTALLKLGLAEELETTTAGNVHRTDGDLQYGIFLTTAGKAAIGVDDDVPSEPAEPRAPAPAPPSKNDAVIALLQRATGATTAELIEATGWLPHTTRAALTGLRKKGHTIERSRRDDATCYRITASA